jgi:hypothetical protein
MTNHFGHALRTAGLLMSSLLSLFGAAPAVDEPRLCNKVVTTLARNAVVDRERRTGNMVEIRACDPGVLQIVAWGTETERPLIVETNRTSLASLTTAADTVYVIQTAGASSNVIQVIVFEKGVPHLRVNEAVKAYADVQFTWKEVLIRIPLPGESPLVFHFPTGIE